MFGGLCFMVNDKMCVGIIKQDLMARIDPKTEDIFLKDKGARIMDFTHRPMKGFLYVDPSGTDMDEDLKKWIFRCLEYNPKAHSSKKSKK